MAPACKKICASFVVLSLAQMWMKNYINILGELDGGVPPIWIWLFFEDDSIIFVDRRGSIRIHDISEENITFLRNSVSIWNNFRRSREVACDCCQSEAHDGDTSLGQRSES